ncbi:hypothetical protein D3C84_685690 [compost metagenome]
MPAGLVNRHDAVCAVVVDADVGRLDVRVADEHQSVAQAGTRIRIEAGDLVQVLLGLQIDVEGIPLTARAHQRVVEEGIGGHLVGEQVGIEGTGRRVPIAVRQRRAERQLDIAGQVLGLLDELDHRNLDRAQAHRELNGIDHLGAFPRDFEEHHTYTQTVFSIRCRLQISGQHLDLIRG